MNMKIPTLLYSELTREVAAEIHKRFGCLQVELNPAQGRLLLTLLTQRDRVAKSLLTEAPATRFLWDFFVFRLYNLICYLFFRRLQILEHYVRAVDAAYGNEISSGGNYIFLLLPLAQKRKGEPSYQVPAK